MLDIFIFLLPPFIACLLMIGILGYMGIHVLKREVIFIDIAMAQVAALGSLLAVILFHSEEHSLLAYGFAFGTTILASLFYAQIGKKVKEIPHEAIIGVSYAIAAAGALFVLGLSTGSDVHMEHMLTGSILWASWHDILICTLIFGLVGLFHYRFRDHFICLSDKMEDTDHHEKSALWDFLFYVSMGLIITLAVHIAGVLVIFSFLILPATISALFSNSWKSRILIAWGSGILASLLGLAFSYSFDFSCGPSVVSFLVLILLIAVIMKRNKNRNA